MPNRNNQRAETEQRSLRFIFRPTGIYQWRVTAPDGQTFHLDATMCRNSGISFKDMEEYLARRSKRPPLTA